MSFQIKCDECGEPCKIIDTEIKKLRRMDGVEYQRYWDTISQCPKCLSVKVVPIDIEVKS